MEFLKRIFSRPEFSGVDFAANVIENGAEPDQRTLIQMLHQEIETAPERIIREAKQSKLALQASLELPVKEIEIPTGLAKKVDRLNKLGFTNSREKAELKYWIHKKAGAANEKNQTRLNIQKLDAAVNDAAYYQRTYPFAKFLTIEELNRICQKYGLIFAPAHAYINEIPDKNLAEIEKAQQLRPLDLPNSAISKGLMYAPIGVLEAVDEVNAQNRGLRPFTAETIEELMDYLNGRRRPRPRNKHITTDSVHVKINLRTELNHAADAMEMNLMMLRNGMRSSFIAPVPANMGEQLFWDSLENLSKDKYQLSEQCGFHIAAPIDHFKLDPGTFEKVGDYGYRVKEDPIVFRFCRGGILVDSKWGLEASDPALINPISN